MSLPHNRAALRDKEFRDAYVDGHVKSYIPFQLRAIREKMGLTQKAFAERIGKPQSVVSRLENTEYGKVTVQTLLDIARGVDVALVVKFASFREFLATYDDLSAEAMAVEPYSAAEIADLSLAPPDTARKEGPKRSSNYGGGLATIGSVVTATNPSATVTDVSRGRPELFPGIHFKTLQIPVSLGQSFGPLQ